jgi:hypothetical protein
MRIILRANPGGSGADSYVDDDARVRVVELYKSSRDGRQIQQSGASSHCYQAHGERHCAA